MRLTDASSVQATHANGDDLVIDGDTLVFTSADKYFGPASISFEVTDGASATDPDGRTASIVLPITVRPRENQPPAFLGAVIEFEPGQEKVIDLLRLTTYPYPDDLDELAYSVLAPAPEGFTLLAVGHASSRSRAQRERAEAAHDVDLARRARRPERGAVRAHPAVDRAVDATPAAARGRHRGRARAATRRP